MKIELKSTKDYAMFESHKLNRPFHDDHQLYESMLKFGFMPSSPIQCVRNGGEKLKVIRGHHRLHYAKKLSLPVWYVIDESNKDLFYLEASSKSHWNVEDFAYARSQEGSESCIKLLSFRKKHGLAVGAAASLVGGQSASSGNMQAAVKRGTFKVGDMIHAEQVVAITDHCRKCGILFATSSAFVGAVSAVLRVPEFDSARFVHCVSLYSANLHRRSNKDGCLDEIDALYNYAAKSKRIALAFRAREESKKRRVA